MVILFESSTWNFGIDEPTQYDTYLHSTSNIAPENLKMVGIWSFLVEAIWAYFQGQTIRFRECNHRYFTKELFLGFILHCHFGVWTHLLITDRSSSVGFLCHGGPSLCRLCQPQGGIFAWITGIEQCHFGLLSWRVDTGEWAQIPWSYIYIYMHCICTKSCAYNVYILYFDSQAKVYNNHQTP